MVENTPYSVDGHDDPHKLVQLFEIYLEGLLQLERIPVEKRTLELGKIAMVLNRDTVDYCLECDPSCPLYTNCKRTIPSHAKKQPVSAIT
ncbi:MAG: hypothetical protein JXA89_21395 [Anaerolineae bacterium]|nr:hypothetical protein [Anaerolineae bacterium]